MWLTALLEYLVTGFWKSYKKSQKPPLSKGYYGMIIVYDDQWYYQCTYSEFSPFIVLNSVPYMSRFAVNNPLFLQLIQHLSLTFLLLCSNVHNFTISYFSCRIIPLHSTPTIWKSHSSTILHSEHDAVFLDQVHIANS